MADRPAHDPTADPRPRLADPAPAPRSRSGPLKLAAALDFQLRRWAIEGYPEESCGVLVGRETATATRVHRAVRLNNVTSSRRRDRYVLDPDGFLSADGAAREEGLEIVGVWHTHPDHPPRPSSTDLAAAWEGYAYLILSVEASGATRAAAWRLRGGEFQEQTIEIEPVRSWREPVTQEALR